MITEAEKISAGEIESLDLQPCAPPTAAGCSRCASGGYSGALCFIGGYAFSIGISSVRKPPIDGFFVTQYVYGVMWR